MHRLIPKSVVCLREGVTPDILLRDALAGLTVAVIALPLAMAFGIASIPPHVAHELAAVHPWLTPPAMGIFTAIVAGFLISALGGSRVQIGGPTGAFIVIVYGVADQFGYAGLATATLMAGVIVLLMGLFRFGAMIKFIPYPVTTGFTTGIAVIIAAAQLKDFLGLTTEPLPAEFVPKLQTLAAALPTISWPTFAVGAASLLFLALMRRLAPRVPAAIIAVAGASAAVALLNLPVETIGSRFGSIPRTLPAPHLPPLHPELIRQLIPSASTIALLCAIESLLSAVVADGMTGRRHRSDCELVAQGAANIASACFWGIPATGAIARTVANIKSGGSTPLAGMFHALFLLLVLLAAAPLARLVPLPTLAAVLLIVAWNMSEIDHFRSLLKAPRSDILVLLTTFALTVFTDLTVAVGVGMILASLLFMRRMAEVAGIQSVARELDDADDNGRSDPDAIDKRSVPHGVEVYEIEGPFFFGVADLLKDTLAALEWPPRVFILRLRKVPIIDATALHALEEFLHKCRRDGTTLVLSGVRPSLISVFKKTGFDLLIGPDNILPHIDAALDRARRLLEQDPHHHR